MADITQSANSPVRSFVARHSLSIDNLKSRFVLGETVKSSEFFSLHDSQQPRFQAFVRLGSLEHRLVPVRIFPVSRTTSFTKIKCDMFDGAGKRLGGFYDFAGQLHVFTNTPGRQGSGGCYGFGPKSPWPDVVGDKVTINFEIEYEGPPSKPVLDTPGRQSRHLDNYSKLFESGEHADVTFTVQGQQILAHKVVLAAQSLYFERMFSTSMKESDSGEIKVLDVRPVIFGAVLKYLYCGEAPEYCGEDTMDLIAAADKYGLDDLKKTSESLLCSQLDKENVIEAILLADRHGCPELFQQATGVLKMHAEDLKKEARWNKFLTNPELLLKLFGLFL